MLILLIIIILLILLIAIYLYFDYKLSDLKRKLILTSNQYNKILSEYTLTKKRYSNLEVKFSTPTAKYAITNNKVQIYLAPTSNSPIIKSLNIQMEVNIVDKATIESETWYYVNLPIDSNINCRGWIRDSDFTFIDNDSNTIENSKQ